MVEFNERETKIIHCMLTLINPQFKSIPLEVKKLTVMASLKARGYNFDEGELTDLINGINKEQVDIGKNALGLLAKHGASIKELGKFKL